ncbi:MAG: HAD-IIB family hydrolase [Xenococcaceae cyanobacterium MO_167.B27]|nr:HAD-IIB family hydrolase [Xenococcaceae cyanobacterium MO_167.B27]
MSKLFVFTDLDGTLLNQEDYDYQPALPVIARLKAQNIPVIPVTSKTRAEVAELCQAIGLNDPFIVENGSGIFIPQQDSRFDVAEATLEGDYYVKTLGCNYIQARAGLKIIQSDVRINNLKGFGDLDEAEIQSLTGLPIKEVRQAKTREFTEPFVTPKDIPKEKIETAAAEYGFRVLIGDRFSHLIGVEAGKGKAVTWLLKHYQSTTDQDKIITVGLGNSPNDLEMLEAVDISIVIASKKGIHPGLANRGWQVPKSPGSIGWAEAVTEILERYN